MSWRAFWAVPDLSHTKLADFFAKSLKLNDLEFLAVGSSPAGPTIRSRFAEGKSFGPGDQMKTEDAPVGAKTGRQSRSNDAGEFETGLTKSKQMIWGSSQLFCQRQINRSSGSIESEERPCKGRWLRMRRQAPFKCKELLGDFWAVPVLSQLKMRLCRDRRGNTGI
jgi:hypothetical protein